MNDIVPHKPRKVRIIGRPKTRVCALACLLAAAVSVLAFAWRDAGDSWLTLMLSLTAAVVAGLLALVLRLVEHPRQIEVTQCWDGNPPVIYARKRR